MFDSAALRVQRRALLTGKRHGFGVTIIITTIGGNVFYPSLVGAAEAEEGGALGGGVRVWAIVETIFCRIEQNLRETARTREGFKLPS